MFAGGYCMDFVITSAKIMGIKNIDKKIELTFTNKIFDFSIFSGNYIKTIYGSNGSGKSGIIHAFDILKTIVLSDFPFKEPIFASKLAKLINKKTNNFYIEVNFSMNINDALKRYRYCLSVSIDDDDVLSIDKEEIDLLDNRMDYSSTVVKTSKGNLVIAPKNNSIIKNYSEAFGRDNSILRSIFPVGKIDADDKELCAFVAVIIFASAINASYGSESDRHLDFDYKTFIDAIRNNKVKRVKFSRSSLTSFGNMMSGDKYLWIIRDNEEKEYTELTKKLLKFLKLAKPSLKDLKIHFKRDGNFSLCELEFVYPGKKKDYRVDYEFESTGIKKLCSLFKAFNEASKGGIVLIDEIDAGVHDVFLTSLIEYFALYNNAQIICTTHNIGLMESLKNMSKSIDILADDSTIHTWVKNGDLSPSSLYKKGYLSGTPFNLNPTDFSEVFSGE